MTFSGIVFILITLLILYYVGMILFDLYKEKMATELKDETKEEEIDITSDMTNFHVTHVSPRDIELPKDHSKAADPAKNRSGKSGEKNELPPFPWDVKDFCKYINMAEPGEDVKALNNIVYECKVEKSLRIKEPDKKPKKNKDSTSEVNNPDETFEETQLEPEASVNKGTTENINSEHQPEIESGQSQSRMNSSDESEPDEDSSDGDDLGNEDSEDYENDEEGVDAYEDEIDERDSKPSDLFKESFGLFGDELEEIE